MGLGKRENGKISIIVTDESNATDVSLVVVVVYLSIALLCPESARRRFTADIGRPTVSGGSVKNSR